MKNKILKSGLSIVLGLSLSACGNSFLDTPMYNAVDIDNGINDVSTVEYALNGAYAYLLQYQAAGNYSSLLGDYASDIVYNGLEMGTHGTDMYQFIYTETTGTLSSIWSYDYKVIDLAARVIQACERLLPDATPAETKDLQMYEAEARTLRAYATLMLTNIYGHQVMVNGQSYANELGIVIVDTPVQAYEHIERNTVGECYTQILSDLNTAVTLFDQGGSRNNMYYLSPQAAYGLLARTNMYLENWSEAASAAQKAIQVSGITSLTYDWDDYKALYNGGKSNVESMFALAISSTQNNGTNSAGQFFNNYGYSLSPYLNSLYAETDCRRAILGFTAVGDDGEPLPWWVDKNPFNGGKFGYFGGTNVTYATNYLINAPEMFLIQAEAYANMNQVSHAQENLLVVAKRNNAITSVADLPSTAQGIIQFLYEERARELFQEGFRLWDLRRWNISCNLDAIAAPEIMFAYTNQHVGDLVFPIPANEVNSGFGVVQNPNWSSSKPK